MRGEERREREKGKKRDKKEKGARSDEGGERRVTSVESRVDRVGRCDVRD